jgi:uncharacterized membrane protein YccC
VWLSIIEAEAIRPDPPPDGVPGYRRNPMSSTSALGIAVRRVARFDRAAISWPAGLLAAIPVVAALGIPIAAGDPVAGVTMGVGAMLVGTAWRTQGGRPPLAVMATDSVLMALSTLVGCLTGDVLWVHLIALAVWSLMAGLLVGLGNGGGAVGTQAIIAVVVFGRFTEPLPQALGLAGLVLSGGAAQVLFLSLVRYPSPLGVQRRATARAYDDLADLAVAAAADSALPAAAALDEADASLASGTLFADQAVLTMRNLVDEGHRVRVGLTALNGLSARLPADGQAAADLHALAGELSATLHLAAATIRRPTDADGQLEAAAQRAGAAIDTFAHDAREEGAEIWPILGRQLAALGGQLRAIASIAPSAGRSGRLRSRRPVGHRGHPLRGLAADIDALVGNLSLQSPAARHALRLAVIVPVATLISRQLPVSHAYWVVVAAATVLRPEFGATFTRGTERASATAVGVALAGLIAAGLQPADGLTVVLVGLMAWLGYATMPASFAVGYAFITALVVFLLNVLSPDTTATATARLLDTVIGAGIGLAVFAAWPTWARLPAQQALSDLVTAQQRYLQAVLGALVTGEPLSAGEARSAARAARLARTRAEADVARSLDEPASRRIDERKGPGLLGEMRRLVRAAHVLRLDAEADETDGRAREPMPRLARLARSIDVELAAVARALHTDDLQLSTEYPDLRIAYHRFAQDASPAERALLPELDELVDAANSVAELVARQP